MRYFFISNEDQSDICKFYKIQFSYFDDFDKIHILVNHIRVPTYVNKG